MATYLQLVQKAMSEAGVTQTNPTPSTLVGLTGLSQKFSVWVTDAWEEIKAENDQDFFVRAWFYATVNPRFYFDLRTTALAQTFPGDTLVGQFSACKMLVTNVIITNGGLWADGSAQGFVEFINLVGSPLDSEPLNIVSTGLEACRFIKWGDYRFDNQTEMGTNYIADLQDIWWDSLRIQSIPTASVSVQERVLPFLDYAQFLQNYDVAMTTVGTPRLVTETPDDGVRMFFYPPPDQPYRVGGYYYKIIPPLVLDNDVPIGLQAVYHNMIAWRAVRYYGLYEQQTAIVAEADRRYSTFKKKMEKDAELPVVFRPIRLY